jgi:hypothetical protein
MLPGPQPQVPAQVLHHKKTHLINMESFKISKSKLLEIRNKIFVEVGIPALESNGFSKSPFITSLHGRNNLGDYTYELCRITKGSKMEHIVTHITKGDKWIKIFLNIFTLYPEIKSIHELKGLDGLQFDLPPNNITEMRLRSDDIKVIPLFSYTFWFGGYKLKKFTTEYEMNKRIGQLSKLIKEDLTNIDTFIKRWFELHQPMVTSWEGRPLDNQSKRQ